MADLAHDVRCRVADGGEVESDLAKDRTRSRPESEPDVDGR